MYVNLTKIDAFFAFIDSDCKKNITICQINMGYKALNSGYLDNSRLI